MTFQNESVAQTLDNAGWQNDTSTFYESTCAFMVDPNQMLVPWKHNPSFPSIVLTHSVTFVLGVAGNGLVIAVMSCDRKEHSATKLFLMSLAVADLLLLLVCAPLETFKYFVLEWDEGVSVCKLASYAEMLSPVASVLNLTAVSLERFVVIVFPMKSRSLCTMNNCKKALFIVWIVSFILTFPVLFTKHTYSMAYCNNHTLVRIHYCNDLQGQEAILFATYRLLILFIVPAVLMIICYAWVIKVLWISTVTMQVLTQSNSNRMRFSLSASTLDSLSVRSSSQQTMSSPDVIPEPGRSRSEDVMRARKQVIKMLVLVVFLFLLCWGPRLVMELLIKHELDLFTPEIYNTRIALYLLPFVHGCINPIIYGFMSSKFRRQLVRHFRRLYCKTRTFHRRPANSPQGGDLRRTDTGSRWLRTSSTFNSSLYSFRTTETDLATI